MLIVGSACASGASAQTTFTNSNPITIDGVNAGPATPYPSTIDISGLSGSISKVTATIEGLSHTWPEDIDILLVGPGGQTVILMSDVDCSADVADINLVFDDGAADLMPDASAPLAGGTFKPTDRDSSGCAGSEPNDNFEAPAPGPPHGTALAAFDGTNPNGTWQLFVRDDFPSEDNGTIAKGWSLTISVTPPAISSPPTVSGNATNNQTLTASAGASSGGGTTTLSFVRCDASGNGCVPIPGATATRRGARTAATSVSYKLTSADIGHAIRVQQTVTNSGGSTSSQSSPTKAVVPDPAACSNVIFGATAGTNTLTGTVGGDRIDGLAGNDIISGVAGDDCLTGGLGNDRVSGGSGKDRMVGGAGKDRLSGGLGTDVISGGGGNDAISAGPGSKHILSGGSGRDAINSVNGKRDRVNGGSGRDTCRADRIDRLRSCQVRRIVR